MYSQCFLLINYCIRLCHPNKMDYLLFWLETILPNIRLETNQIMTWMLLLSNIDSRPMIAKKCDCKSLQSLASWNCLAANCLSGHQHCWSTKYPQGNLTFKLWSSKGEGAQKGSLLVGPYYYGLRTFGCFSIFGKLGKKIKPYWHNNLVYFQTLSFLSEISHIFTKTMNAINYVLKQNLISGYWQRDK